MPHTNDVLLLPNQGWDKRIHVCRNGDLVQTFIVVTQRFVVLVDTLINPATAQQMVAYARPYLDAGRTLLVINTHADYDHAWGNQLFAGPDARSPAPVIGSQRCAERLLGGEDASLLQKLRTAEPEIFGDVHITSPTVRFEGRMTIDGGDLTLHLFPTPGHTDDHIAIFIPEISTLLAGDAAELPYPAAHTVAGLPLMRASLQTLAALNARAVLYCHAPAAIGAQLLHDNIAYFDALERACRAVPGSLPGDPSVGDADLIAVTGCRYEDVTPQTEHWRHVHDHYRTAAHAAQLRMMLAWVKSEAERTDQESSTSNRPT